MKKITLCILLYLFVLNSCRVPEPLFIYNENLEFNHIDDAILSFSIDTYIYNPSRYSYQLKGLTFDVEHNLEKIGFGTLVRPIKVQSLDTVVLPIICTLKLSQLQKKHQEFLIDRDTYFSIKGNANAVHPLKTINKDISLNIAYNFKELISDKLINENLDVGQIEIEKINPFSIKDLTKSNIFLNVEIPNNHFFDFQIEHIELTVLSQKKHRILLKGSINSIVSIGNSETIKIPLKVETHNLNVFQNIGRLLLRRDHAKYTGNGHMIIDIQGHTFNIPFNKEFNVKAKLFSDSKSNLYSIFKPLNNH